MARLSVMESLERRAYFAIAFAAPVSFQVEPNDIGTLQSPVIGDFDKDGKADVIVVDAATNGTGVGRYAFAAGRGNGTYQLGPSFSGGVFSGPAMAGDFNGDGNLDLVASNPGPPDGTSTGNTLSVVLGNGNGTFGTPANFTVGQEPLTLAVADFNGDGKADVAVGNRTGNTVSILLGNASTTLGTATTIAVGQDPASVVTGDFNADGKPDLVVGSAGGSSPGLYGLLGNGDGTFAAPVITSGPPGVTAVGDFNADGKLDVAVSASVSGQATILTGNGNGTFTGTAPYPTTGFIALVADYDADGKQDIAFSGNTTTSSTQFVQILSGTGAGSFLPTLVLSADNPGAGSVGDVNGDGKPDLIVTGFSGNNRVIDTILNTSGAAGGGTADLTAQVVSALPAAVVGGAKGKLTVRVTNSGTGLVSGPVSVGLYASAGNGSFEPSSDTLITTLTKNLKLKTTKAKTLKFNFAYPASVADGSYSILAVVDPSNSVSESNDTNNVAVAPTPVTIAAPFVDLTGTLPGAPAALTQGAKGTVSVLVANGGNVVASGTVTVTVHASTDATLAGSVGQLGTATTKLKLKAGAAKAFKVKYAVPTLTAGNYFLVAQIDSGNGVTESNETNNLVSNPVAIS